MQFLLQPPEHGAGNHRHRYFMGKQRSLQKRPSAVRVSIRGQQRKTPKKRKVPSDALALPGWCGTAASLRGRGSNCPCSQQA